MTAVAQRHFVPPTAIHNYSPQKTNPELTRNIENLITELVCMIIKDRISVMYTFNAIHENLRDYFTLHKGKENATQKELLTVATATLTFGAYAMAGAGSTAMGANINTDLFQSLGRGGEQLTKVPEARKAAKQAEENTINKMTESELQTANGAKSQEQRAIDNLKQMISRIVEALTRAFSQN